MFTEIKLNPKQEKEMQGLKDGELLIAFSDGDLILMQTMRSETIYCWNGRKWVAYSSPSERNKIMQ